MKQLNTLLVFLLALAYLPSAQAQKEHAKATTHRTTGHTTKAKATPKPSAPAEQSVKVWVNTPSGVYHYPGQRWYGRTKHGEYMTEKEAIVKGYRGTHNGQ